ncbi:hypothetical protein L0P88_16965 [Muricauda sp. SCSIO 64092]|uniref:DUF6515 family protein n=1 Tax=Allomuricauda sp. SCSIO 64092 TaxID=2908842 RepID=UPI001FF0E1EF|nr:DUF6515 family protein [Muricauda sp. SCSIO 64092]UOY05633.1 hypothetical protein L0P88_16965 [Muricauda sp. SCSIO 64092]
MKLLRIVFPVLFFVLLLPTNRSQAQEVRQNTTVIVASGTRKGQLRRQTRRQVRRIHRRNRFRTLRRLPAGTRAVLFRGVEYYPVQGIYYVKRNGVYIRRLPPIGFRMASLTGPMFRLAVGGNAYVFSEGVFYRGVDDQFEMVAPPKGAIVEELPKDVEELLLDGMTAYELYDTLYAKTEGGYEVIGTMDDFE